MTQTFISSVEDAAVDLSADFTLLTVPTDGQPWGAGEVYALKVLQLVSDASSLGEVTPLVYRQVRECLEDNEAARLLETLYGLPPGLTIRASELIAVGTTSWIIKAADQRSSEARAVKLVLPKYFHDHRVTSASATYKKQMAAFSKSPLVPTVHGSGPRWIEMDFVAGVTLDEYLRILLRLSPDDESVEDPLGPESELEIRAGGVGAGDAVRQTREIIDKLLEALVSVCKVHPTLRAHGDISPTNVMVVKQHPLMLRLIDFGRNSLLEEGVGSTVVLERAALFAAPELKTGGEPTWKADAYSIAMIGLDTCYRYSQKRSTDEEDQSQELTLSLVSGQLSRVWESSPRLARNLEDLLDKKPENRALIALGESSSVTQPKDAYLALRKMSQLEHDIEAKFQGDNGDPRQVASLISLIFGRSDRLKGLLAVARPASESSSAAESHRGASVLFGVAFLTMALWVLATGVLIGKTGGFDLITWATNGFRRSDLENVWKGLTAEPGVLVVWTFGLALVAYYINIFALIGHRGSRSTQLRLANYSMRFQPLVSLAAIVFVMLFLPQWWAIAAGVIMFFTVLNNFLAYRVVRQAAEDAPRELDPVCELDRNFVDRFRMYAPTMAAYALGLLILGVLLALGWTRDEWEFALLVIALNIFQMGQKVCVAEAPWVRGNVDRSIFVVRRIQAKQQSSETCPD